MYSLTNVITYLWMCRAVVYDYLRKVKTKYTDIFNLCERAIVLVGSKPVSGNIYFGGIIL